MFSSVQFIGLFQLHALRPELLRTRYVRSTIDITMFVNNITVNKNLLCLVIISQLYWV